MNNESSYIESEQLETVKGDDAIDESEDKKQAQYESPLSSSLLSTEKNVEIDQGNNSSIHSVITTSNINIKPPSTPTSSSSITAVSPINVTGSTSIDTSATTMLCEASGFDLIKGKRVESIQGDMIVSDLGELREVKEEGGKEEKEEWDGVTNDNEVAVTSGTVSPARSGLSTGTADEIILMGALERYYFYLSVVVEWAFLAFFMGIFVVVYCMLFVVCTGAAVVGTCMKCGNPFREPGRRVGGRGGRG